MMKLADLLQYYRPGSYDWTWEEEFADIPTKFPDEFPQLVQAIQKDGIQKAIHLGDDGRIWDGHKRITVAQLLGIEEIPVMRIAHYPQHDGGSHDVEYDPTAPCILCGEPVVSASMGGTVVCPWCDCGTSRRKDGLMAPIRFRGSREWRESPIHPKALAHYGVEFAKSFDPTWEPPE